MHLTIMATMATYILLSMVKSAIASPMISDL